MRQIVAAPSGCTVPGYGCQVHHAELDWVKGGQTNISDETLACGPHNRLVEDGGWKTRKLIDSARACAAATLVKRG